jgi:hypothetical protein
VFSAAREARETEHFTLLHRFDRRPRRNPSEQRNLGAGRPCAPLFLEILGRELERPALIEPTLEISLGLEHRDVFVDCCERRQIQPGRDLFIARAIPVLVHKIRDEIEHLLLPLGECHRSIHLFAPFSANKKRKSRGKQLYYLATLRFLDPQSQLTVRVRTSYVRERPHTCDS